jgi:hypothetical protein
LVFAGAAPEHVALTIVNKSRSKPTIVTGRNTSERREPDE